ncbi:WG repeat-containing protein [Aquimarina aquimarini]|uniref:WG repeat-containing protein n=1 Tax=Aquimarina aquimarini TaxID=1191734 RepID=UPI001F32DDB5|nr:WG repeat-containing protein [Aquimarina aquimarini]
MNFEELKSKIKASKWEQHVIDNQTIISLEKTIFGDYPNVNIKEIVLENIKFYNNKKDYKKIEADNHYNIEFPLNVKRKRIKNFDLKILIEAEEYFNFTINNKKTSIDTLQVKDIQINDQTISFIKKETDNENNFEIYVSDEKGLFYKSISSSSVTKLTNKDIAYYNSLLLFLKDLKIALNNNKFIDEKELKKYIKEKQPEEVSISEKNKLYNFDFSVYPKEIIFRVLGNKYNKQIVVSFSENLNKNNFIAKSDNKYGLIDTNGNWIIKPTDGRLSENEYFPDYYSKNYNETIWISPDNKKKTKYDFVISKNNMLIEKKYKIGEYTTTTGYGLFDAIKKEIILPVEKEIFIKADKSFYFVKKNLEKNLVLKGLYDLEGNIIFGLENHDIEICANNLVIITKNEKDFLFKLDTINKQPKLLTSRDYSKIDAPHYNTTIEELEEEPFFRASKNDGKASDYLTNNGEIAIDGEKYSQVIKSYDRFIVKDKKGIFSILDKFGKLIKILDKNIIPKSEYSAYLLQAKNKTTGLYGYLDKKGNLVIPFMYSTATRFVKFSKETPAKASVSTVDEKGNRTSYFIDTNNDLIGKKDFHKKEIEAEHIIEVEQN